MVHALLQVDCTEMCVGSACTQPSYNDKNPSSVFFFKSPYMFSPLSNEAIRFCDVTKSTPLPRLLSIIVRAKCFHVCANHSSCLSMCCSCAY